MIEVIDLGRMEYRAAWEEQLRHLERVQNGAPDTLLLVEHPPVLTLGASFHEENLLYPIAEYETRGIAVERTDRGGDVTYHGPNQLVIYPIFDVARHGRDLHKWIRGLEETMLITLRHFGIEGRRFPPHTGAWIGDKKVAAIGIKVKRWVSLHGIALNCDNDLSIFDTFVPCGIADYGVTSLMEATGKVITIDDAKPVVAEAFRELFSQNA